MALVTCPDCTKEISDAATACPQCGRPMKNSASEPVKVQEDGGFLGRSGTAWGAANFGCLALMIGGVIFVLMMVAFSNQ